MRWREHRGLVALVVLLLICVLGTAGAFLTRPTPVNRIHSQPPTPSLAFYDDGAIGFSYPARWHSGGWVDQAGPVALSAGPAALLTFLSDRPFEPTCRTTKAASGSQETSCEGPPTSAVSIRWFRPTGLSDREFLDRELGHPRVVDGHLGWSYEGMGRGGCLAGQHEVAVGVPYDAGQPDRAGVEMLACLQGPDLAQHLLEVHRMVASLHVDVRAKRGQAVAARCWDGLHKDVLSAGAVTVAWIRTRRPAAFPGAPDTAPAAWCWTDGNNGKDPYDLWAVSAGHPAVRLGHSSERSPPQTPHVTSGTT